MVLNSSFSKQFILSPYQLQNEAGTVIDFEFGSETEAYFSCGAQHRGKYYVFGGTKQTQQISMVTDCGLVRVGSLHFDFSRGSCASLDDNYYVALCFGKGSKLCSLWSGEDNHVLPESIVKHDYTDIAIVNRTIIAVGDSTGTSAEILDLVTFPYTGSDLSWQLKTPFPYATTYKNYATVARGDAAYYFGGYNGSGMMKHITRFNPLDNEWTLLGELNQPRDFHSVALVGGRFLVVGGEL